MEANQPKKDYDTRDDTFNPPGLVGYCCDAPLPPLPVQHTPTISLEMIAQNAAMIRNTEAIAETPAYHTGLTSIYLISTVGVLGVAAWVFAYYATLKRKQTRPDNRVTNIIAPRF